MLQAILCFYWDINEIKFLLFFHMDDCRFIMIVVQNYWNKSWRYRFSRFNSIFLHNWVTTIPFSNISVQATASQYKHTVISGNCHLNIIPFKTTMRTGMKYKISLTTCATRLAEITDFWLSLVKESQWQRLKYYHYNHHDLRIVKNPMEMFCLRFLCEKSLVNQVKID